MNKYALDGIIADAKRGTSILYVAHTSTDVKAAHRYVLDAIGAEEVTSCRANGRERVEFKGAGEIRFISSSSTSGRGHAVDVVYVADHRDGSNPNVMQGLIPAARRDVIRA